MIMENKFITFLKNILSMIIANGIAFIVSALVTLIVPRFLGVEDYSYVQLYIFYTSYISYLHYGWVDGIRLRYAGNDYEKLNKRVFSSQILIYTIIQIVLAFSVVCVSSFSLPTSKKTLVFICLGICMLFRLPRLMPQYILEMTNRIRECARITMMEKITFFSLLIFFIFLRNISLINVLLSDLVAQIISSIYSFYLCLDIIRAKPCFNKQIVSEIQQNIKSGIQLTIANVSSLFVIGIIRQSIESQWSISTFGKISLTISVSNLLMVFIRSIAMVMFPTLRRVNNDKLVYIYSAMRTCIMIPLLGLLIVYYPIKSILSIWLPNYADGLKYMALLFPMCIFESKMSMLIETYLKTIRKEKILLYVNIITVTLSFICSFIFAVLLHNLNLTVLSIVLLLAFKSTFAETILSKYIDIKVMKDICIEILLSLTFIISSWFIGGVLGLIVYTILYLCYIYFSKNEIKKVLKMIKKGVY